MALWPLSRTFATAESKVGYAQAAAVEKAGTMFAFGDVTGQARKLYAAT